MTFGMSRRGETQRDRDADNAINNVHFILVIHWGLFAIATDCEYSRLIRLFTAAATLTLLILIQPISLKNLNEIG